MFGKVKITDFAKRQFDPKSGGTKILDKTPQEFEEIVNMNIFGYEESTLESHNLVKILDGYAPFCKLVVLKNYYTNAKVGSMPIDISNYQYIRHGYSSRTEKELPVMSRWFELPLSAPKADYLIVVVYSREQLLEEHQMQWVKTDMDGPIPEFELGTDDAWGVVAILGQTHPNEEPMQPITMMRNALGVEEGGSGVPIDRDKYLASVDFWSQNAIVKS